MKHRGSCHCGAIEVRLTLPAPPAEIPVRACDCSFCRAHGARTVTDPSGTAEIRFREPAHVRRYRFARKTADFLICGNCGVYVAAVAIFESGPKATVNINVLEDRDAFTGESTIASYDGETVEGKSARRDKRWTPAIIRIDE